MFAQLLLWAAFQQAPAAREAEIARAEKLHEDGLNRFAAGQVEAGSKALLESFSIHQKWNVTASSIVNLRALAFGYDGAGERQTALGYYGRALQMARKTGEKRLEASTLRDIGVLYYNLDDNTRAIAHMEQALALQRTIERPSTLAATLFSLGETRRYMRQPGPARSTLEEALRVARESKARLIEADALSSLALLDLQTPDLASAKRRFDEALALRLAGKDLRGEASVRTRLALYFEATGDRAAAIESARAGVARFVTAKYRGGEAFARQSLAMLLRKNGQPAEAAAEMQLAVDAAESLRRKLADRDLRATYIGYIQGRYEFLIDTLLELDGGDPRRAFEMSERARAREIVEALADAGVAAGRPAPASAAAIQALLDGGTTLLEYSLGEPASHLFIVTRTGIRYRKLPGRSVLDPAVRRAYEAYRDPKVPRPDAANLRALVFGDVPPSKRLVVVADGALQYLPFSDLAPGVPVVIAPSASVLLALRARAGKAPERNLTVIADPHVPELARLPFARQEASGIVQYAGRGMVFSAIGKDATREALKDYPARILHLAAHGQFDSERPERMEIALTGGPLRLRDIAGLGVESSLVVLSACQTALGKEMKREGLLGLTHEFQRAGVSRVVASLWKVDDRATAELMRHFYEGLLVRGTPPPEALRDAQKALAANVRWAHPFYWAGFTVQGDWR